jgi:hypothetical protein
VASKLAPEAEAEVVVAAAAPAASLLESVQLLGLLESASEHLLNGHRGWRWQMLLRGCLLLGCLLFWLSKPRTTAPVLRHL